MQSRGRALAGYGAVVWELVMAARAESERAKGREKQMETNMALQDGSWPYSHEHGHAVDA
jgi:hypothetical protein